MRNYQLKQVREFLRYYRWLEARAKAKGKGKVSNSHKVSKEATWRQ
jgi:hypothetical protein